MNNSEAAIFVFLIPAIVYLLALVIFCTLARRGRCSSLTKLPLLVSRNTSQVDVILFLGVIIGSMAGCGWFLHQYLYPVGWHFSLASRFLWLF